MNQENQDDPEIVRKNYEIGFILQDPESEILLEEALNAYDVFISHKSILKETRLEYPIKKKEFAYFGYYQFEAVGDVIENISKALSLISGILRFIIVTPPPKMTQEVKEESTKTSPEPKTDSRPTVLSNEALEEKLEEILQ